MTSGPRPLLPGPFVLGPSQLYLPPPLKLIPPSKPAHRSPGKHRDTAAPVSHVNFFFTAKEVHEIYLPTAADADAVTSHQDAPLAHLWAAFFGARGERLKEGNQHFLDIAIDMRKRVTPPLPAQFIGSPIVNATVEYTFSTSRSSSAVREKAARMRNKVKTFRSENVGALLHEMTFELGAQRRLTFSRASACHCSVKGGNWDGGCLF